LVLAPFKQQQYGEGQWLPCRASILRQAAALDGWTMYYWGFGDFVMWGLGNPSIWVVVISLLIDLNAIDLIL
jgi:hypothetical protein